MDRRVALPTFPVPGPEYDQRYAADLVNSLNQMVVLLRNPGEGRQTTIVLTNLQSNDQGLEAGTIFQVDGVLRIPVPNRAYLAGTFASGRVGTVAVTV